MKTVDDIHIMLTVCGAYSNSYRYNIDRVINESVIQWYESVGAGIPATHRRRHRAHSPPLNQSITRTSQPGSDSSPVSRYPPSSSVMINAQPSIAAHSQSRSLHTHLLQLFHYQPLRSAITIRLAPKG